MDWYRHKSSRQVHENRAGGLVYLTFPILEKIDWASHLFSTRMGGASEGIYRSMNLSYTRGDRKESVDENFRRIAAALGCGVEDIVCSDQTHTTNLRIVGKADGGKGITREKDYRDVDGLLTDEPGVYLATFFADCVPLYFVDTRRKAIALAHSGWRGTVARMGQCVVEKLRESYGTDPADIVAAVGRLSVRNAMRSARTWRTLLRRRLQSPGRSGRYCLRRAAANTSLICGGRTRLCWRRRGFPGNRFR